jgi:hypothetical protein
MVLALLTVHLAQSRSVQPPLAKLLLAHALCQSPIWTTPPLCRTFQTDVTAPESTTLTFEHRHAYIHSSNEVCHTSCKGTAADGCRSSLATAVAKPYIPVDDASRRNGRERRTTVLAIEYALRVL